METSLVSIITPCFNSVSLISKTYESIKSQTYQNWEWLVVDDCSTDNSLKLLNQFAQEDSRVKPISLKKNSGAAVARNTAIENAKGEYLAFLDADDLWHPNKLEVFLGRMLQDHVELACGAYDRISLEGTVRQSPFIPPEKVDYKDLLHTCSIGTSTVVVSRKAVGETRMDPSLRRGQDYLFWLSILRKGFLAQSFNQKVLTYYRVGNRRSLSNNKFRKAVGQWRIYRHYLKLNFIESVYYFFHYAFHGFAKNIIK